MALTRLGTYGWPTRHSRKSRRPEHTSQAIAIHTYLQWRARGELLLPMYTDKDSLGPEYREEFESW